MALLEIKNLSKSFGDLQVLRDINIEVQKGEVIVIIGPSGSGKSTMLRCCNLLEKPSGGEIIYQGEDITKLGKKVKNYRKNVGMVFQRFNLFTMKTVLDNITVAPMKLNKLSKEQAEEKALELLDKVGLKAKANVYPETLSGGQQQRVAIARAIAQAPPVILADEPTGNLDSNSTKEIMDILKGLHSEGRTVILITHDNDIAAQAKRVIKIKDGKVESDSGQSVPTEELPTGA